MNYSLEKICSLIKMDYSKVPQSVIKELVDFHIYLDSIGLEIIDNGSFKEVIANDIIYNPSQIFNENTHVGIFEIEDNINIKTVVNNYIATKINKTK